MNRFKRKTKIELSKAPDGITPDAQAPVEFFFVQI